MAEVAVVTGGGGGGAMVVSQEGSMTSEDAKTGDLEALGSELTGATAEVMARPSTEGRHFNFDAEGDRELCSAGGAGGEKFKFEEAISAADYRFTGDMTMYNDRNMRTRRRLRKELKIRAWLMSFFNTFGVSRAPPAPPMKRFFRAGRCSRSEPDPPFISGLLRQHMYAFEMCCCKAIFASSDFSMEDAIEAVEADLAHDFHHEMTAEAFCDSLFETVDMWTVSVDIDEYVGFLRSLYLRVTYVDEATGKRRFREVTDIIALDQADARSEVQGRKRVIQRLFNVGVLEAMSEKKASTL